MGADRGHSSQGGRTGSSSRTLASETMKPAVRSKPQGETLWSEMPPDGTGGNFVAASASEGLGDALDICCREHPTTGRSLLPPGCS